MYTYWGEVDITGRDASTEANRGPTASAATGSLLRGSTLAPQPAPTLENATRSPDGRAGAGSSRPPCPREAQPEGGLMFTPPRAQSRRRACRGVCARRCGRRALVRVRHAVTSMYRGSASVAGLPLWLRSHLRRQHRGIGPPGHHGQRCSLGCRGLPCLIRLHRSQNIRILHPRRLQHLPQRIR